MKTWWDEHGTTDFLSHLRDSPARVWCRDFIKRKLLDGMSIAEVGFGGCNERIALNDFLRQYNTPYCGYDFTELFVDAARNTFPYDQWNFHDIQSGSLPRPFDIVYSQHVLEHCGGLNPAFRNMLRSAGRFCVVIFFITPTSDPDSINWEQYPVYQNRYQLGHIQKVCERESFTTQFRTFVNEDSANRKCPGEETVLVATRSR